MGLRIVHLADLHLDMPLAGIASTSHLPAARREGLRQALKQTVHFAKEQQADLLTIGGDLYEAARVTQDTIQFLRTLFHQAQPLQIAIAPGNHDPYVTSSPYATLDWPANVRIFREPRLTSIALKDGFTTWGAGHDSPAFTQNLLRGFRLPHNAPALLLLHGTDTSLSLGQEKAILCPFSEGDVRAAGFGLALLGHIHHGRLHPAARPLICYPGSPEPLGFDEETGHSILLVEWAGHGWRVESRDISQWMVRSASIDLSDLTSRDAVIEALRGLWRHERQGKRCLARVTLEGQPARTLDLDLATIRAALKPEFEAVLLSDHTLPPFDLDALKHDSTVMGAFVRRVSQEIEAAEQQGHAQNQEVLQRALRYGLMALENREIAGP